MDNAAGAFAIPAMEPSQFVIPTNNKLAAKMLERARESWAFEAAVTLMNITEWMKSHQHLVTALCVAAAVLVAAGCALALRYSRQAAARLITPAVPTTPLAGKRVTALVNPFGGRRDALAQFAQIRRVLEASGVEVHTVLTTHAGHAREVAAAIDAAANAALISVGGDGLFCEVLDGLLSRPDAAKTLVALPLGIVPAGTGNGVTASLGIRSTAGAAAAILAARISPLDLMRVDLLPPILGAPAGGAAAARTAAAGAAPLRSLHAGLSVAYGAIADHDVLAERTLRWMGSIRTIIAPLTVIALARSARARLTFTEVAEDGGAAGAPVVIEDDFSLVHACNLPWIAHDCFMARDAQRNDGCIHVVILRKCSRLTMLRCFLAMSTGEHNHLREVSIHKVRSFTLEPLTPTANVCVDGEHVPLCTVRATSMPGAVRVFPGTEFLATTPGADAVKKAQ
jgi:sphingosine kinase